MVSIVKVKIKKLGGSKGITIVPEMLSDSRFPFSMKDKLVLEITSDGELLLRKLRDGEKI